jgi:predicted nucleic acid-binding protein
LARLLKAIPNGKVVFIDANVFHFYLRGPDDVKKACVSFLQRVEKREIRDITSALVLDEVMYKILLKSIEDKHNKNPVDVIRKSVEEIGIESREVKKAIDIILGIRNLSVLSVDQNQVEDSVDLMQKYSVLARDAIHLSTMKSIECKDLISADRDFDLVQDIVRWSPL